MNNCFKLPELKDKVVVVTGAGGGICSVLSKAIAENGAKVILLDNNLNKVKKLEEELKGQGLIAKAYECDVLSMDSLNKVHEETLKEFGKIDILLNGAGGNSPKATCKKEYADFTSKDDFFSLDENGIDFVFDLNIKGTVLPTKVFAKDMIGKKHCSILNISSMNAFTPLTKIPAYSAAKAGVSNFTKWLAVHLSKVGIRVNAIAPGFLLSDQNRSLLLNEDGSYTDRSKKIIAATPMERFGNFEELVGATLFLLSEEAASFITGVVLPIDGGFSAYSGV